MDNIQPPSFRIFATPAPHLAYSDQFFHLQKISQISDLLEVYPVVLPVGSVISSRFSFKIPGSASATVIQPQEVLPSIKDLHSVTTRMEDAYNMEGMRSINLIKNATNNQHAVQAYSSLLQHLQSFDTPAVQSFVNMPFMFKIQGFIVTKFPLYQLNCLLNENWLEEDVFNALLE
ncbi:hypothetical protein C0995_007339, partial [Termitomyces sp. Mi166